jgi:hypothetical protein
MLSGAVDVAPPAAGGELDPELLQAAAAASREAATAVLAARLGQLRTDISFSYERLQICYSKSGGDGRAWFSWDRAGS